MPFIGNQPAEAYSSFQKQDFTTSATTSYTLDHPVANQNEIALFINFVRQEPTAAYTASGTSLTLTSATSASDDMYCVYLGKAVQTVNPPNSSVGNSQLDVSAINSQTAETSIAGGDEVLIYDTSASALRKMTRTNFVSGVGGDNTPSFYAKLSAAQSISSGSWTKINLNAEDWDTDSSFDTSTYKYTVPTGEGGKYLIGYSLGTDSVIDDNERLLGKIYLNGSGYNPMTTQERGTATDTDLFVSMNSIMDLSAGDYLELYAYQNEGSSQSMLATYTRMWGFKLIGV